MSNVKLKNVMTGEVRTFPFVIAEKVLRVCDTLRKPPFILDDDRFEYKSGELFRPKPKIEEIAKEIEEDASTRGASDKHGGERREDE